MYVRSPSGDVSLQYTGTSTRQCTIAAQAVRAGYADDSGDKSNQHYILKATEAMYSAML